MQLFGLGGGESTTVPFLHSLCLNWCKGIWNKKTCERVCKEQKTVPHRLWGLVAFVAKLTRGTTGNGDIWTGKDESVEKLHGN